MINPAALQQLTVNRVLVMLREPEVLFWIFLFPILLTIGIGIAFGDANPENLRVAVERGSPAEPYAEGLGEEPLLDVVLVDSQDISDLLRRGEATVVLGGSNARNEIVVQFDPTRPEAGTARLLVDSRLQEAAGATRPLAMREVEVRVRGQRYIDWLIPGLIGFNLMGTGLWSVGFYTTQARENRELRRLVATPMRKSDFLLSQVLARFAFLVGEIPLIVLFGWLIFGVVMEGNPIWLGVIVLLGASCFTGLGLLAGSRARTTEGVSGIINLIMLPMLVLSGVFFSVQRFPDNVQPLIQALPLTALNNALRAVYNDGVSIGAVVGELGIVLLWTAGSFALALRLFRWQ